MVFEIFENAFFYGTRLTSKVIKLLYKMIIQSVFIFWLYDKRALTICFSRKIK